jgi:hypothetical protein
MGPLSSGIFQAFRMRQENVRILAFSVDREISARVSLRDTEMNASANPLLLNRRGWYEAGKVHEALSGDMVRSKSEVIISNLLHKGEIPFRYEQLLLAGDGTPRLPDFTLTSRGETYFWEHLGMLDQTTYANEWDRKRAWYEEWFPGQLLVTRESPQLSSDAETLISALRSGDLEIIRSYAPA